MTMVDKVINSIYKVPVRMINQLKRTKIKFIEEEEKTMNKNKVTGNQIEELLKRAKVKASTVEDKVTIVNVTLESGFIITESAACVDKANYSEEVGRDICMGKIRDKLWELEGYRLQDALFNGAKATSKPTAKERVKLEIEELRDRREKLCNFLYGWRSSQLNEAEKLLLNEQLTAMEKYEAVLAARLSIWRELPDPQAQIKG